jgi:hypothetical protein
MSFMMSVANKPIMLSVVMLSVDVLSVIMLSVDMLSVVMLSVNMLNVVAPNGASNKPERLAREKHSTLL